MFNILLNQIATVLCRFYNYIHTGDWPTLHFFAWAFAKLASSPICPLSLPRGHLGHFTSFSTFLNVSAVFSISLSLCGLRGHLLGPSASLILSLVRSRLLWKPLVAFLISVSVGFVSRNSVYCKCVWSVFVVSVSHRTYFRACPRVAGLQWHLVRLSPEDSMGLSFLPGFPLGALFSGVSAHL